MSDVLFPVSSTMREKIMCSYKKIKTKVLNSTTYKKVLCIRDKLANGMLSAFLTLLSCINPIWTFLFVKTSDFDDETSQASNEIS